MIDVLQSASGDAPTVVALTAGVFALSALGLRLQIRDGRMLNLGQIGYTAIAAYTMTLLVRHTGIPALAAAAVAIAVAVGMALAVGLAAAGPKTDMLAIVTIGIAEVVRVIVIGNPGWSGGIQGSTAHVRPIIDLLEPVVDRVTSFGVEMSAADVLATITWLLVVAGIVFVRRMRRSPWGRALIASGLDPDAASAAGKNPSSYRLQTSLIAAGFAGVAGVMLAAGAFVVHPGQFDPAFGLIPVLLALLFGGFVTIVLGALATGAIFAWTDGLIAADALPVVADRASLRLIALGVAGLVVVAVVSRRSKEVTDG